jgi:hypothetical protein
MRASLYQLSKDDSHFFLNGAAIPGRAETKIGFDGVVELSDGQAGHGRPPGGYAVNAIIL